MGQEVEMSDAGPVQDDAGPATTSADAATTSEEDSPRQVLKTLQDNLSIIEKAVKSKEPRMFGRVLRQTAHIRKKLTQELLTGFIDAVLPAHSPSTDKLLGILQGSSMLDSNGATEALAELNFTTQSYLPEVEVYVVLLTVMYLIDNKRYDEVKEVTDFAVERIWTTNRRTLDVLAARLYFYYAWVYEVLGKLSDIKGKLLILHRTAVLRHDEIGQETLLNLLLRNYLHYNLYGQAEKLRSKAQRLDQFRSHQQQSRYLFYLGRIRATQLEYTESKECLQQAARKAPTSAHGFHVIVNKWRILVRLLLGEIPERNEFTQPGMAEQLVAYYELTQAVRSGDLVAFRQVTEKFAAVFEADKTHNLIVRLHHTVIRAGLRRINLAYSRISLPDICAKLGLASVEDTECIVAKAIRDGGIEATIDHEQGFMQSKDVVDIYSTMEPLTAFHARVAFCLDLHNEAVRAMRFEPDAHKKALESVMANRERLTTEQEIAKALEDDDDDF